jgi:hypothetical protein
MKGKFTSDKIMGLGIVFFSIILHLVIIPIQCDSAGNGGGVGPDFFPKMIAMIMGVLGLWLFLQKSPIKVEKKEKRNTKSVIITAIALVAYVYLAEYLGYVTSTVIALLFFLIYYGCRNKIVIVTIITLLTGSLYFFFGQVMQVMLPRGILI